MAQTARHVPQRTCVGCGQVAGKRELLRIVRTPEGQVVVDPTGKRNGRGAYVHRSGTCFDRAVGGRLWRVLRVDAPQGGDVERVLREAFTAALAVPEPRKPMVHRAPVPLPAHLIARGQRGPVRTPPRRKPTA